MANKKAKIVRTATEALKILWEKGFLKTWKKFGAIEEYLGKSGYHFSVPELGMALKRAKHLTRRGKTGSYEYIQKYPFISEEEPTMAKKGVNRRKI
jgi:hypothetical protein